MMSFGPIGARCALWRLQVSRTCACSNLLARYRMPRSRIAVRAHSPGVVMNCKCVWVSVYHEHCNLAPGGAERPNNSKETVLHEVNSSERSELECSCFWEMSWASEVCFLHSDINTGIFDNGVTYQACSQRRCWWDSIEFDKESVWGRQMKAYFSEGPNRTYITGVSTTHVLPRCSRTRVRFHAISYPGASVKEHIRYLFVRDKLLAGCKLFAEAPALWIE